MKIKETMVNVGRSINLLKQHKIDENNDSRVAYSWIWEFSKKVVVVIFLIYIFNYILCWLASFLCGIKGWNIPYIDTFIMSTNETTQIVLGGYLVKAMLENVFRSRNQQCNISSNNKDINDSGDYSDIE